MQRVASAAKVDTLANMCASLIYKEDDLPYLTAGLPGVGGQIKQQIEDFLVEELPLYPASGEGTHSYVTIEKHGITTLEAVKRFARAIGCSPRDVGYAGLKDAKGVTRQTLSVEHTDPDRLVALDIDAISIVSVTRHTNKLRIGHLAGNRFSVKIRNSCSNAESQAKAILDVLCSRGLPNCFGPQRFGARGDNAEIGKAVVQGNFDEALAWILGKPNQFDRGDVHRARTLFDKNDLEAALKAWPYPFHDQRKLLKALLRSNRNTSNAWRTVNHPLRKLYLSAFQSALFNQVVAARLNNIDQIQKGDMAWLHRNGACFHVDDAAKEQPRCDALEISPTGPLIGKRMTETTGEAGTIENEILAGADITSGQLNQQSQAKLTGGRRPLRVPLTGASLTSEHDTHGEYLLLGFELPPGSYATCVTREICRDG